MPLTFAPGIHTALLIVIDPELSVHDRCISAAAAPAAAGNRALVDGRRLCRVAAPAAIEARRLSILCCGDRQEAISVRVSS